MIIAVLSCSVPVGAWLVLRKRCGAGVMPLLAGIAAYIVISLARGLLRAAFLEGLRGTHWLFYIVSAFISGSAEESGRYIVFRNVLPQRKRWADCAAYALGHFCTEALLTFRMPEDIADSLLFCYITATGLAVSAAWSVLGFAAAHFAEDRRLLYAAVGLHTLADIIPALYLLDAVSIGGYFALKLLFTAAVCWLGHKVWSYYADL